MVKKEEKLIRPAHEAMYNEPYLEKGCIFNDKFEII